MKFIKKIRRYYKTLKLLNSACDTLINVPEIKSLDYCYKTFGSKEMGFIDSSALDIGCGDLPKNPFQAKHTFGVDIRENEAKGIRYADLAVEPIPFEDKKFNYITAHDFLEHVPRILYTPNRRFPFIELMNEVYRTLKSDGIFFSYTPIYPYSASFRDPTHVNILSDETFPLYFDDEYTWAKMYGFTGRFKVLYQARRGIHLISVMQKLPHN
jgi:SAM-dependent methyltransferase